jgi:hypothetical protein
MARDFNEQYLKSWKEVQSFVQECHCVKIESSLSGLRLERISCGVYTGVRATLPRVLDRIVRDVRIVLGSEWGHFYQSSGHIIFSLSSVSRAMPPRLM